MIRKKISKIFLVLIILTSLIWLYSNNFKKDKITKEISEEEDVLYNSNIIINVNSKSNLLNGVFLGIGDSGGIKVKTNSKITEYLSVESFTFV